jgi:hypothetical protein
MAELKKVTREREQVHLLRVCTYQITALVIVSPVVLLLWRDKLT